MENEATKITRLRKEGNLQEAYTFGKESVQKYPDGTNIKRAFAWVLYDMMKATANYKSNDLFFSYADEVAALELTADDVLFFDKIAWPIRAIIADATMQNNHDFGFFSKAFRLLQNLNFPKPSDAYSLLLGVFLNKDSEWPDRLNFLIWWDLDNLQEKDFVKFLKDDGTKLMSTAERAYIAFAKLSLASNNRQQMEAALPKLAGIYEKHHEFAYMPYYEAKILIALGRNDEAATKLKVFARKKDGQFWVWELLGDASEDANIRFSCYCKALTCQSKEEMLVSLREKAAMTFHQMGHDAQAHLEVDKAVATRNAQGWRMTGSLSALTNEDWYRNSQPAKGNFNFYTQNTAAAETMLFGHPKPQNGRNNKRNNGNAYSNSPQGNSRQPQQDYSGKLRIAAGGFGFVGTGDSAVFVPAFLVEQSGAANGDMVRGKCVKSFDKKKQKDGLKAVTMSK